MDDRFEVNDEGLSVGVKVGVGGVGGLGVVVKSCNHAEHGKISRGVSPQPSSVAVSKSYQMLKATKRSNSNLEFATKCEAPDTSTPCYVSTNTWLSFHRAKL